MDDKTAAEYARRRSASIRERDAWNARKMSSSSDCERSTSSVPKYRSSGMVSDVRSRPQQSVPQTPWEHRESPLEILEPTDLPPSPLASQFIPVPDLPPPPPPPPHSPRPFDVGPDEETPLTSEEPAPPPPPHSPRPRSFEVRGYFDEPEEYEVPAPPPPSHSPRPIDVTDEDPWASQAAAWALRRQHAALQQEDMGPTAQCEDPDNVYPVIPLRREMHPGSAGPEFSGYHYPQPHPQKHHTFDIYQQEQYVNQYHPEATRSRSLFDAEDPRYYGHSTSHPHSQSHTPNRSREVSPRPPPHHQSRSHSRSPRPHSRGHSRSPAGSRPISRQPSPAPAFGRFSGGLQYQYDTENGGLGGSAGTRENAAINENAKGEYKGMQLRREWGVDLGDVPVSVLVGPARI
jgi:hypothetical protein